MARQVNPGGRGESKRLGGRLLEWDSLRRDELWVDVFPRGKEHILRRNEVWFIRSNKKKDTLDAYDLEAPCCKYRIGQQGNTKTGISTYLCCPPTKSKTFQASPFSFASALSIGPQRH